ncbi:MAG: hypothetical protein R3200_02785 [Xanthomonadales bacterium]|nr:hypothetical protein [Xanthomonadales bacterium]
MRATFVAMGMTLGLAAEAGDLVFRDGFEVPPQMQPSELPSFASLGLYDSASHWNQPIGADPAIASDSAILVQSLEASGSIALQVGQYSAPVFFADPTTPRFDVELACGIEADLGVVRMLDVPIPPWAVPSDDVDGSANPVPPTACGFDSDQDNHMVVLDLTRRCEFDLFQARLVDGKWIASVANNLSIDGAGVYPGGVSSRGSGFPFLGGVIWPDELATGEITHALAFSYPCTKAGGPVPPATFSDGVTEDPSAIPIGARVQLDPALDLDTLALQPYERTVAKALQVYGMVLVDTGGFCGFADPIGLYAVDPDSVSGNPYQGLLPDGDFIAVDLPLDRFRVLEFGEQIADFTERAFVPDGVCSAFDRP